MRVAPPVPALLAACLLASASPVHEVAAQPAAQAAAVPGATPAAPAAPATAPWLGAWQLNVGRSVYRPGPPPYRRGTLRTDQVGDRIRMVYDLIPVRGGLTHMEWTGRFDGRDYAVQGVDQVITYAYTPLDDRTMQVTLKVDGRVAAEAKVVLSPDGTTLTTDTRVLDARAGNLVTTTVYERLPAGS